MALFLVRGKFWNKSEWQRFTKRLDVESKEKAIEVAYSLLGSHHKVKRSKIIIEGVEEIGKGSKGEDKS